MEGIKKGLSKLYNVSLFTSVVVLAIGIFLFVYPDFIFKIAAIIIGILFLIPGITSLIDYFREKNQTSLITGIILVIVSVIVMSFGEIIKVIFPFIFGIFFVVNGITRLQYAIQIRKEFGVKESKPLVMALLIIFCGVVFIIYPFTVADTITQIMGLFLCIYAILDICNHVMVKKEIKNASNDMKNAIIEVEAVEKND